MFRIERIVAPAAWVAALLTAGAPAVSAQETVFVTFQFAQPSIAKRFGNALAATERDMADWLIARLEQKYPYWNYRRTAATTNDFPRMMLSLTHSPPDWVIAIALQETAVSVPDLAGQVKWIDRAELDRLGFPPLADIPGSIKQSVDQKLLAPPLGHDLFKALQKVPLVRKVWLANSPTPRAVLALDWGRYWRLGLSDFAVRYQTGQGVATVTCRGVGEKLAFPAPPPASGLVVLLHEFQLGMHVQPVGPVLRELSRSQPLAVFLTRFDSQAEVLLSQSGDAGVPSMAPGR